MLCPYWKGCILIWSLILHVLHLIENVKIYHCLKRYDWQEYHFHSISQSKVPILNLLQKVTRNHIWNEKIFKLVSTLYDKVMLFSANLLTVWKTILYIKTEKLNLNELSKLNLYLPSQDNIDIIVFGKSRRRDNSNFWASAFWTKFFVKVGQTTVPMIIAAFSIILIIIA